MDKLILEHIKTNRMKVGVIAALQDAASLYGVGQTAAAIGVHPAHISNLPSRGVSPTLRKALEQTGILQQAQKQHRRAAFFGYGEEGKRLADAFDRYCQSAGQDESLTKWARTLAEWQLKKEAKNGQQ